MRAILVILIIAVIVVLAGIATGFLNINLIRGAQPPTVTATGNGITAKGGQAPAFDVETGSVKVGSEPANVALPTLEISRPADQSAAAVNNGS